MSRKEMETTQEIRIWKVVKEEAGRLSGGVANTSLGFGDLVGCGWERILTQLGRGHQNHETHLHVWARQGMLRAIENEARRPLPRGL